MSLKLADCAIEDVLRIFLEQDVPVGLIVPTKTGLSKRIMDAHASLRQFLLDVDLHNYAMQGRGASQSGVKLKSWFVFKERLEETTTSLYRPETKRGDPRIWISGLQQYASAGNLLVLLAISGQLYVVNGSDKSLLQSATEPRSVLYSLLNTSSFARSVVADELLTALRKVGNCGYVKTLRAGPTGVGYTLEALLGIEANSRRAPDYKGIEIKASRVSPAGRPISRTTLFSKTPDWALSPYSAKSLVETYGVTNEHGRKQIYCSVTNEPNNTFGFYLLLDEFSDALISLRRGPDLGRAERDEKLLYWSMGALKTALLSKQRETFWVKARSKGSGQSEEFQYFEVVHTRSPRPSYLYYLLEVGYLQLDLLAHIVAKADGKYAVRDHGYLFKILENHRALLFGSPRTYKLRA